MICMLPSGLAGLFTWFGYSTGMIVEMISFWMIFYGLGLLSTMVFAPRSILLLGWSFQDLKTELKMSDGNLITHLRILYDAGLISKSKENSDRPQTNYALSEKGQLAYQDYLNLLEQIIKAAKN